MTIIFWDSSALAKRYALEVGTLEVNEVFNACYAQTAGMVSVSVVYAENLFATCAEAEPWRYYGGRISKSVYRSTW